MSRHPSAGAEHACSGPQAWHEEYAGDSLRDGGFEVAHGTGELWGHDGLAGVEAAGLLMCWWALDVGEIF